jgi:succinate dehydrogenase / fumarate reductase flavoprotein subunit
VFGKLAGEHAARYAKETPVGKAEDGQIVEIAQWALAPFGRDGTGENPFQIQSNLQDMMQELVGIVRTEKELDEAMGKINLLKERADRAACGGNRGYNPGWHTAMELKHMLTVADAVARAAKERKESRGGHFREDCPTKSEEFGKVNICIRKDERGGMEVNHIPKLKMREDLQQIIDEMK